MRSGDDEAVRLRLEGGANVHARDEVGTPAVHCAVLFRAVGAPHAPLAVGSFGEIVTRCVSRSMAM